MTVVVPYYDQPTLLRRQMKVWQTWPDSVQIVIVDDGSPKFPAIEIIRAEKFHRTKVFRIVPDILWNVAGARNLGCSQSAGWLHLTDLDTALSVGAITQLADEIKTASPKDFFTHRRFGLLGQPLWFSASILTLHRDLFDAVGGFEEDFSGGYGRELEDFWQRLQRFGRMRGSKAGADVVSPWECREAVAGGQRELARNRTLFIERRAAGYPRPAGINRFEWQPQQ